MGTYGRFVSEYGACGAELVHLCGRVASVIGMVKRAAPPARPALRLRGETGPVPFLEVDPPHTSQRCPRCGHAEKANRSTRDYVRCRRCGLAGPADVVAGVNVRDRARSAWVFCHRTRSCPRPAGGRTDATRDRLVVGDSREGDEV
ncbi:zinc ribbon domain-containing protein [Streptomyces sp. NPDC048415]|uniref:zinc ribbon domain-containing protein n=1 Tax=Streptomyces sp. NPDC048415 TaxID=3154822 RepID=UPI003440237C